MGKSIILFICSGLLILGGGFFIVWAEHQVKYAEPRVPLEMVAYGGLTAQEKSLIPVSPKDSHVRKMRVNEEIKPFIKPDYEHEFVYSVTFHHTETDSSGNLVVFIDVDRKTVIGKGVADDGLG